MTLTYQGNPCKYGLVVDHNHKTDNIRELLCYLCNVGLGSFKDDEGRLKNAIAYLRKHGD
jgi:hypothetical protein